MLEWMWKFVLGGKRGALNVYGNCNNMQNYVYNKPVNIYILICTYVYTHIFIHIFPNTLITPGSCCSKKSVIDCRNGNDIELI